VLSRRIVPLINLSIAVLLILFAVAAYWYAWRPLPKESGEIAAPLAAPAGIARDELGVPHITAQSWEDAVFVQGYVTASERMWQMDILRRVAAGELAEVLGRGGLESDRDARRLRLRRIADEKYRNLAPGDLAVLAAYARGVNYYLETHRGKAGLEFKLLGYDPRPWTVSDSILVGLEMFRTLTSSWRQDMVKQAMLSTGDLAKVQYLFPVRTGPEPQPGSNSWAVAGARTATGKPILASDPHLEWSIPSTWYMVHLKAPGLNVTGVSLPGLPCVIIGHNEYIAWGMTNLPFDVQDLYREQLNPETGRYAYRGQTEQAIRESEVIAVKGIAPVQFTNWITRHGPLLLSETGQYYALRWTAAERGEFYFPFLAIDRARNWEEFTAALSRYDGPAQNFVYADINGNIGYHAAGLLPVRRNFDGDAPLDGSSGEYEWDGFIPFDQLPSYYNPPSGIIVTANQNPFPKDYPYKVNGNFAPYYRARQIRDLLTARMRWRTPGMLDVQKDVYSGFSHFLARQAVAACDRRKAQNELVARSVAVLRSWNGQMDKDSPAALIAALLYEQVRRAVAESASPKSGAQYARAIAPAVIEQLLRERPAGWFADWDEMLAARLAAAVDAAADLQGGNVDGWRWGAYNQVTIVHPVASRIPVVGKYFNIGPVWMSGSTTTVKQTARNVGPSMRMVVDFGDLDHSLNNITIGESGHFLSRHYKDQWNAYYVGRSFPMQFHHVEAKSHLRLRPMGH
jgi:penicillin amidase